MPIFFIHEINFSSNIISHLIFFFQMQRTIFLNNWILRLWFCYFYIYFFTLCFSYPWTVHGIYIRSAYDIFFALFCQQFGTNSQFVPAVENFLLDMLFKFEFQLLWFDHLTLFSERYNLYKYTWYLYVSIQIKKYWFYWTLLYLFFQ